MNSGAPVDPKVMLDLLIEEKIEMIHPNRIGWNNVVSRFFYPSTPILEIETNWHTVISFADRVRASILKEWKDKNDLLKKRTNRYATMQAYLELARRERNPGRAWNLLNSADKLLPLVVDLNSIDSAVLRLRIWDGGLERMNEYAAKQLRDCERDLCCLGRPPNQWNENMPEEMKGILDKMLNDIDTIFEGVATGEVWPQRMPLVVKGALSDMLISMNSLVHASGSVKDWRSSFLEKLIKTIHTARETIIAANAVDDESSEVSPANLNRITKAMSSAVDHLGILDLTKVTKRALDEEAMALSSDDHFPCAPPPTKVRREYCRQATRAQLWNSVNAGLALKYDLWNSYTTILLFALVPSLLIAEIFYHLHAPRAQWWYYPFIYFTILGLFGGALSARTIPREWDMKNRSPQLARMSMILRMLIGAVGAFVLFVLLGSGLVESGYSIRVDDLENYLLFIALGILAGFSEQLFVTALDKAGSNLDLQGMTSDEG